MISEQLIDDRSAMIDALMISEQLIDDRSAMIDALMISEQLIDDRSWRNGLLVVPTQAAKRQHSQGGQRRKVCWMVVNYS